MPHIKTQQSARLALVVLVASVIISASVVSAGVLCCPACSAWEGDCPIAGITLNEYDTESKCVASVPGACLFNPKGTWTGIFESCAPSPCTFSAAVNVAFSKRLGTCVPGEGYHAAPIRTDGIYGAYAAFVNHSQTVAAAVRNAYDGNQLIVGPSRTVVSDLKVSGNALFWTELSLNNKRRLRSRNADGYTEYTFTIDNYGSGLNYGASESYIVTGITNRMGNGIDWNVYEFGKPESRVSVFDIKQAGAALVEYLPIMRGHHAFVLDVDRMNPKGPNRQDTIYLHAWDVRPGMNFTHRMLNVNISHCLYSEQAKLNPDTILYNNYNVFCQDDNVLESCTFYYAGTRGEGSPGVLCKMDMNGTTTPLIDKSHSDYVLSEPNPLFSPSGVVYAASIATTKVTPGDTMVYLYATNNSKASYHWYNDMLNYDVTYCFAPAFPNLHLPSSPRLNIYVALVGHKLIYRVTPGFGTAAFFGFDFDTGEVTPVNLPWGTPNTRCNYYTYGGSCDHCSDEVIQGYTAVYAMNNGSLMFSFAQNNNGFIYSGVAQLESSFVLDKNPAFGCVKTGCSAAGGFCDRGQCHCYPGCSGADCSQGNAFCSKKTLDWCSDSYIQRQ